MNFLPLLAPAVILISVSVSVSASATSYLDLNFNNDSAALEYGTFQKNGMHLSGGVLYSEDDSKLASVGVHAVDVNSENKALKLGVGGKVYGYSTDVNDGSALAVGGFVRYMPVKLNGLGFHAHAYYAPSVLSFSDTEHFIDIGVGVEYNIFSAASVFLGYRLVEAEVKDVKNDAEIVGSTHFGLRISF